MQPIPVSILGGFLGAGKTTAINHLLRGARPGTLVLVNDFGSIDVDGALIREQGGDVLALSNGCVCCSIGPSFCATLGRMLERQPPPTSILVEASGVSDPWKIAQLVKLEPAARVAAVVVLADALHFAEQAADRWIADTLQRQLARADFVALTKCDSADAATRRSARAAIEAMRPGVGVVEIARGELPRQLLDARPEARAVDFGGGWRVEHGFASWTWSPPGALDRQRLELALAQLPASVLRVKGFVRLGAQARRHVVQRVGRRCAIEDWPGPPGDDQLVFIGTPQMPAAGQLEGSLGACVLDA